MSQRPGLRSRVANASLALVVNALIWFFIPEYLLGALGQADAGVASFTYALVLVFGMTITGVEVLAALTQGSALSTLFSAGASIASAFYVYLATGGGVVSVTSGAVTVVLTFPVLVALMVIPALFNVARLGISYLLDESEGSRPIQDDIRI
ncbi:MAG: hypothetical protein JRN09_05210 [Nitrososphaerota archaeon]|nr:hypothetical protein [Nitrososphaerota archaeon]